MGSLPPLLSRPLWRPCRRCWLSSGAEEAAGGWQQQTDLGEAASSDVAWDMGHRTRGWSGQDWSSPQQGLVPSVPLWPLLPVSTRREILLNVTTRKDQMIRVKPLQERERGTKGGINC